MMNTKMKRRDLHSSDEEYYSPYFEKYDADGDSYSLSWRYLGAFIDEDDGYYTRKVLWAAYYDPNYSGYQIGEYSYYDWENSQWDNSTCVEGATCSKMDCHNTNTTSTTWSLVGVYKETLEFDNDTFFEQLFKHQGVCLWGGDNSNYQFMQTMRDDDMAIFDSGCYKVKSGIYIGPKPVEGGDLELAVYSDTYCMTELSSYSVDDYITSSTGKSWTNAFSKWNSMMDAYKICQPCRAYSKYNNTQDEWSDHRQRNLVEYEDGQGDAEANGFNCYDDAGYRNCNQCYKFETKTDMEEASKDDLELATSQGTIVSIDVDGEMYGGTVSYETDAPTEMQDADADVAYSSMGFAGVVIVIVGILFSGLLTKKHRRKRRVITREDGQPTFDNELLS